MTFDATSFVGGNFRPHLSYDYGYDEANVDEGQPQIESNVLRTVDRAGHGTHVAGIVAASPNNQEGVAGVCWDCSLLISKISHLVFGSLEWVNQGVDDAHWIEDWHGAIDRGAQVITSPSPATASSKPPPNNHPSPAAAQCRASRARHHSRSSGSASRSARHGIGNRQTVNGVHGLEGTRTGENDTNPSQGAWVCRLDLHPAAASQKCLALRKVWHVKRSAHEEVERPHGRAKCADRNDHEARNLRDPDPSQIHPDSVQRTSWAGCDLLPLSTWDQPGSQRKTSLATFGAQL